MSRISLEEFLAPISHRLGRAVPPDSVSPIAAVALHPARTTDGLSETGLADCFAEEASKIHVQVSRCSPEGAASAVLRIIEREGEGGVVYADDPYLDALGIPAALTRCAAVQSATRWDASAARDANVGACARARYGITHPVCAIAETGTVVQTCSVQCGRSISLLPLVHIAVIEADSVLPVMGEALERFAAVAGGDGSGLPSQITMVSGPSATSDIELVRVEGAHGPMYVHYVIVGG